VRLQRAIDGMADCAAAGAPLSSPAPKGASFMAEQLPSAERRAMIAPEAGLSVSRQCVLFGSALYL